MYESLFTKGFSRYWRKGFRCCGFILCFIIICSTFKLLYPLSTVDNAVKSGLWINNVQGMLMANNMFSNSEPIAKKVMEPLCRKLSGGADYCDAEGDIRVQADSRTIYVVIPQNSISNSTNSWTILPYPRKDITFVNSWSIKLVGYSGSKSNIPKCTQIHDNPAILFSLGGYLGNQFHDFSDLILPLYATSFSLQKEVHLLATDFRPWWISKYREILSRLSRHQIVDVDEQTGQVHCYQKLVAGLQYYNELILDQSEYHYQGSPMYNFRQLLRQVYSLDRKQATNYSSQVTKSPRMMIIARKRTRVVSNEGDLVRLAKELGFEVISVEPTTSMNMTSFGQLVNSCDVLMGVHGAGVTNMVFLPDNALLIQLVPFGKMVNFARLDYGNPARRMNIRYLEYEISLDESSLNQQYPADHPVIRDPMSLRRQGFAMLSSVYLKRQNITVDIKRFRGTLVKAIEILRQ